MADEQTPNSDLIEDALRQAERQLEERLDALRQSALGDPTPSTKAVDPDVAVLRPTGGSTNSPEVLSADDPARDIWGEDSGNDDVRFTPKGALDDEEFAAPPALESAPEAISAHLSSHAPAWDDFTESEDEGEPEPPISREPVRRAAAPVEREESRPTWTSTNAARGASMSRPSTPPVAAGPVVPTEDEVQFWAHTRTALRSLQNVTDAIPSEVSNAVTENVERIVQDEMHSATQSIRQLQQSFQQGLPKVVDRLESTIEQGFGSPNAALRQLRDELPAHVDRGSRELRAAIQEDLARNADTQHTTLQRDVAKLEQSIAANVTRMAQTIGDGVGGVEKEVENLGETFSKFERGMRDEFDRVEQQLRGAIELVETSLRDELIEPVETVRKIDEELPARFGRIERTVTEQVQSSQRDLSGVLMTLVEVNRAALDRVTAISAAMDEERARRAEDTELVVDTVTTGWEGLAGALKSLYNQNEQIDRRIDAVEKRIGKLRDVEKVVDTTLGEFRDEVANLRPAPVIVTVTHPDGEVQNQTQGGWTPNRPQGSGSNRKNKK